jgi:hypothetical protein
MVPGMLGFVTFNSVVVLDRRQEACYLVSSVSHFEPLCDIGNTDICNTAIETSRITCRNVLENRARGKISSTARFRNDRTYERLCLW